MFICEKCDEATEPRQPVNMLVVEKRKKVYESRKRIRGVWEASPSFGEEIVKELQVCPSCYESSTGLKPKMVEQRNEETNVRRKSRPRFNPKHETRPRSRTRASSRSAKADRSTPLTQKLSNFKKS